MIAASEEFFDRPLASALADLPPERGVDVYWLGQSGFVLRSARTCVVIDPYLSDSLAAKHRGRHYPHRRMAPPPIAPDALVGVDFVFCTHRHSDHMDPDTLPVLAAVNPRCRFVAPRAESARAIEIGVPVSRLTTIEAGERIETATLEAFAIAAAHETLEVDCAGAHRFLGYVIGLGGVRLYHSGDCVPYDGLAEAVARLKPDIALLPINGRDAERRSHGIPGNFHADEAARLCREAGVPLMIGHHFGLFDFNTVDPEDAETALRGVGRLARAGCRLRLTPITQTEPKLEPSS